MIENTKIILITITFLLFGCAPMTWEKPGLTQDQLNRDTYECEKDARLGGYNGPDFKRAPAFMIDHFYRNFYEHCMNVKGYTATPR